MWICPRRTCVSLSMNTSTGGVHTGENRQTDRCGAGEDVFMLYAFQSFLLFSRLLFGKDLT